MKTMFFALLLNLILFSTAVAEQVQISTTLGEIVVELNAQKAPRTVANFLAYVEEGHYDNTIFHRVIKGFMIQGGGLDKDMKNRPTRKPIPNEADNGLTNVTGTIAMARTSDPHSATAQFFINTKDNLFLDHKAKTPQAWGYCVFGQVVSGMDIVRTIEAVNTTNRGGHADVPVEPVMIQTIRLLKSK